MTREEIGLRVKDLAHYMVGLNEGQLRSERLHRLSQLGQLGEKTVLIERYVLEYVNNVNSRARRVNKDVTEVGIVLSHFGDRRGDSFVYVFVLEDNNKVI